MLWEIDDPAMGGTISMPGTPIKIHGCEDRPLRPAPALGQHTDDILKEFFEIPGVIFDILLVTVFNGDYSI